MKRLHTSSGSQCGEAVCHEAPRTEILTIKVVFLFSLFQYLFSITNYHQKLQKEPPCNLTPCHSTPTSCFSSTTPSHQTTNGKHSISIYVPGCQGQVQKGPDLQKGHSCGSSDSASASFLGQTASYLAEPHTADTHPCWAERKNVSKYEIKYMDYMVRYMKSMII